jgi:hypothetical protein
MADWGATGDWGSDWKKDDAAKKDSKDWGDWGAADWAKKSKKSDWGAEDWGTAAKKDEGRVELK